MLQYTPVGEKVIREYNGRVEGISDENPRDWPRSPWELFEVSWEGPESETGYNRISPWEAKPVVSGELQEKMESITGPVLDDALREKLIRAIQRVSETAAAQPFIAPVPMEVPLYYKQIPLPMDLGTITARLESRYYRYRKIAGRWVVWLRLHLHCGCWPRLFVAGKSTHTNMMSS